MPPPPARRPGRSPRCWRRSASTTRRTGGPSQDVGPFAAKGRDWAWLAQDGRDYLDLHHTADDTLDKIDPKALTQNVAVYAVFAYLAAEADGGFGSQTKTVQPPRE